jgi:hypothetical protein
LSGVMNGAFQNMNGDFWMIDTCYCWKLCTTRVLLLLFMNYEVLEHLQQFAIFYLANLVFRQLLKR